MYHPRVIAARISQLERELHPPPLRTYTVPEVEEWSARLRDAWDPKGQPCRALSPEEQAFILNEWILTKCDFIYWVERYAFINVKGLEVRRAYPLFDTQRMILSRMAELEAKTLDGERNDGILALILKARQLGASTLAQLLSAHRMTTQTNLLGLIASAEPSKSAFIYGMFQRVLDNLPPYLCPPIEIQKRNFPQEVRFATGSNYWAAAGKSTAGMSKETSDRGSRGQVGRGMTLSLVHLSEVSTWDNPAQISGSLLPTIPEPEPRVLALFESTAKGTNSYWQRLWNISKSGMNRFTPIFIPWYAEPSRYRRRPPATWSPTVVTQRYAERVEETSPRWMGGRRYVLSREQLFWYESTRLAFEAEHDLSTFLEEYPADDEEAFQAASDLAVPPTVLQKILDTARTIVGAVEIAPRMDLQVSHPEEWTPSIR